MATTFGNDEDDSICVSSIKTEDWTSIGESTLGDFSFTLALRRRLFLRP